MRALFFSFLFFWGGCPEEMYHVLISGVGSKETKMRQCTCGRVANAKMDIWSNKKKMGLEMSTYEEI